MDVACLVSGGKDSLLAAHVAASWGWTVSSFVTIEPEDPDPELFHHPNTKWVALQAEAMGVRHRPVALPKGEPEAEALRGALTGLCIDGIVTGALASEFQRTRFERVCHDLGIKSFAPLWHHEPHQHLRDVVGAGIRARFVRVAADGLGRDWLGRDLDAAAISDLEAVEKRTRLNVAGEGGEYETFVTDAPLFRKRIEILEAVPEWRRDQGTWRIVRAGLAAKPPVISAA